MSLTTPPVKTSVILDKPSDWDEWIFLIEQKAEGANIWDLVNPDLIIEPAQPGEPDEPTPDSVRQDAIAITELSAAERDTYKLLWASFKNRLAKYEKKHAALQDIQNFILSTVSRTNLSFVMGKKTPYAKLAALKKHLAPTDRARKLELSRAYQALKKAPRQGPLDKWLQQWEKTYTDAKKLGLPEVQEDSPLYDFLLAIKNLEPNFAGTHEILIAQKAKEGTALPTIFDLIEDFRNHRRINQATSDSRSSHSAFASLQGEPDESENKEKKCLCGDVHLFDQCPYFIDHLRPSGWSPNPEIAKRIDDKLQKHGKLRAAVQRARQQAGKNKGKPIAVAPATSDKQTPKSSSSKDATEVGAFALNERNDWKIRNSWILDSAANVHVCNDRSRFTPTRNAKEDDALYAGKTCYPVEAYGTVNITVKTPTGPQTMILLDVALAPGFLTNCVALARLTKKGVHLDTEQHRLHRTGSTMCYVESLDGFFVLEHNEPSMSAALATKQATKTSRPDHEASADKWHRIMGHAGPEAIGHLEQAVAGAQVQGTAPNTIDCEECALSKAHRIVSRRADTENPANEPLERIAYDLIPMTTAYNKDKWVSHFYCTTTSMNFVYTHPRKGQATDIIQEFLAMIHTRYQRTVRYFRTDDEQSLGTAYHELMASKGITTEPSAPYTPAQNGAAERSGGVMITKARSMRIAAKLPANLWPEMVQTAGYLANRTPTKQLGWRTPFELLTGSKPNLSHLHVYGCRAYPLIKHGIPRKEKLEPRAHIGYLVGYDSTNIYRIWIPSQNKVVRTRDVTFNDGQFYDPSEIDLSLLLREEVAQIIEVLDPPPPVQLTQSEESDNDLLELTSSDDSRHTTSSENIVLTEPEKERSLLTPPESTHETLPSMASEEGTDARIDTLIDATPADNVAPRASEIDSQIRYDYILPERSSRRRMAHAIALAQTTGLSAYHSAFATGLTRETDMPWQHLHPDHLPPEPRTWRQMLKHGFASQFRQAASTELRDLERKETFIDVPKAKELATQTLPLLWVFKYKFDTNGFLTKFKARLCVRGDLQTTDQDTYAATLAARTFRALMAIAAAFDLEIRHYDAVNAFTNSKLDEKVYCDYPEGFERLGKCLLLLRALYGLKRSPLLWYTDFTTTLEELGLQPVPGVNCLYTNDRLIVFFFVDDIVILCLPIYLDRLARFETRLLNRYEMRSLGDLKWFLGIRIERDRPARKLWLCQDSYIDKIATKFHCDKGKSPRTPLPTEELHPSSEDQKATAQQILAYQQRVGSLNFAAVVTRPDIARAASKLSEYLQNPSPAHLSAADRVISYLYGTKTLAIEYSGRIDSSNIFICSADAAFADDVEAPMDICSNSMEDRLTGVPRNRKLLPRPALKPNSSQYPLLLKK